MQLLKDEITVGFIGTGVMGREMVLRLLKIGYSVKVYNRTKSSAQSLLEAGAEWKDTVEALAANTDVIITMVGYPRDVEEVYFSRGGILHFAKAGAYLIDMTTSSPDLAVKIGKEGASKGFRVMDAPVSGGDIGAREGRLSIMVGGEEADFAAVKPILDVLGQNIILQGPHGAGQHTKMCNQIAIASNMIGVSESISYAKRAGLDPDRVLKSITMGAAGSWSLSNLAPRMIEDDMEPGFYIKHFIKDMTIALEEANRMGLSVPGLRLSKEIYTSLADEGYNDKGTQALVKFYDVK
ncbi:NAD(P)-dependent oxidoreductase [Alicyclobacillus sp. SO9]|uniref:NAD(P)-dependent oxidoreductase n=1 Tax=Alicyclobacillus sp. SO9 TaxID=2665646 RepID=UPI0018E89B05|nr:NAD(P)-dependent oxidoreductase [Alicyclobacillus sp. SO9]QQE77974.1 NAD(P)-dependent oxidoreductase [Alicyclobacillus sp. SO9]